MSTIYVNCDQPGCATSESVWVEDTYSEFDSLDGESISATCKEH